MNDTIARGLALAALKKSKLNAEDIEALKSIGHFLSGWNCGTGMPVSEPQTIPYTYATGDYYIVSALAESGSDNYKPSGASYSGAASMAVETEGVKVNDFYFYDGTNWILLDNSGGTLDHNLLANRDAENQHPISAIEGLEEALAEKADADNVPTMLSELTDDSTHRVVTDVEKSTWNAKGTYSKPFAGIPKTDLSSDVQGSLDLADSALQEVPSTYRTAAAQDVIDADRVAYTAQSKTEAQKDQARANVGAAEKEPHPYAYDGVNLKELFGDADALHTALAAEDYSHIHNGDYYPVTFNGTYRDYGEWVALAGTKYYSDTALKTEAGTLDADTVTTYVDASPAYYNITISGTTYHVKMQDCQRWREKTINQDSLMEANINVYYQYGDSGVLSGKKPHIMWLARDGIGNFKMRSSNQQWADAVEEFSTGDGTTSVFLPDDATLKCVRYVCVDGALMTYNTAYTVDTATGKVTFKSSYIPADGADIIISRTTHDCPWVGSAIFQTLNDPTHGLMRLITDTAFAAHILGGNGMRYYGETRTVANSTSGGWISRGKGFLPTESEVWDAEIYSTRGNASHLPQLPVFAEGGRRHIMKGLTNGASRNNWWEASSNSAIYVCYVSNNGFASSNNARYALALVPGFVSY